MADEQKKITGESIYEEEMSETTGIHTITRSSIQTRLSKPESEVQFYDKSNFPQELELPERMKENILAQEVHWQAKRILCGREPDITQRDFDYAKRFVEILTAPSYRTAEDVAHLQMLESLINVDLTHKIEEQLAFGQPNSILAQERVVLGINTEKEEKPFQVKVLEVEGEDHKKRTEEWRKKTKAPDMFVYEDLSGEFSIYLSAENAKSILNSGAEDKMRNEAIRKLRHEYRHTQRSITLGRNKTLFRFIDEPLTDIIGYQYLTIFLNLLTKTTDTVKFGEFFDAYENGDNEHMADCYSRVADAIGAKGLLLLGGKNSSDCYAEEDGIKQLPLAEGNFDKNEWLQLAETILTLRENKDVDWQVKFEKNLRNDQIPLKQLEISHMMLIIQFKSASILNSDAHLVRVLLQILQTEIERRRRLGEEGMNSEAA